MRQFGQMGLLGLTVPAEHGDGAQHANPNPKKPNPNQLRTALTRTRTLTRTLTFTLARRRGLRRVRPVRARGGAG